MCILVDIKLPCAVVTLVVYMDLSDSGDDSCKEVAVRPRPKKKRGARRPRPINDVIHGKTFRKLMVPLINKKTDALSFDFRSYGKMVRTGGCGAYLLLNIKLVMHMWVEE